MFRPRIKILRWAAIAAAVFLIGSAGLVARPTKAMIVTLPFPPFTTITLEDIPLKTKSFIDKVRDTLAKQYKTVGDVSFKSSLDIFQARLLQEVQTQLATVGPGQKPLFLTNPKSFFKNVTNAAAGDYIDDFTRGVTGEVGPGTSTSGARGKFLISRLLRAQANQVVGGITSQCKEACTVSFSTDNVDVAEFNSLSEKEFKELTQNGQGLHNIHEWKVVKLSYEIGKAGGVQSKYDVDKTADLTCPDIQPVPTTGPELPWVIAIGQSYGPLSAEDCLSNLTQLLLGEQSVAQSETYQCFQDCQAGGGALTDAINSLTATDIFAAVKNASPKQAPAAVANALSNDKSDIGALLTAAGAMTATIQQTVQGEQTNLNPNIKPVTSKVSDQVKSPSPTASTLLGIPFVGENGQFVYTGSSVADILKGVSSFLNSPVGKALFNYFKSKCGLNPDLCQGPSNARSSIGQLIFGSGGPTGTAGAQLLYATLGQVDIRSGNPGQNEISITDQLSVNGLIDAGFRQAIEETLTVQEAIDKGFLDSQRTFGFDKNGQEPSNGYPFRALQYLRKYRVTPVGWELAAKYSQLFDHRDLSLGYLTSRYNTCNQDPAHAVCTGGTKADQSCQADADCGTDDNGATITCGASPYCGLVDPNWVLKAPQTFCRRQGAGEEIITKEFVCDVNNVDATTGQTIVAGQTCDPNGIGTCTDVAAPNCVASATNPRPDVGRWVIERNSDTCADAQSCISENEDGTCLAYGYCIQERQQFKFDGTQCAVENSSCASFTNPVGQQVAYLQNTLDSRNCTADNAGCTQYCRAPDYDPVTQKCATPPSSPAARINFTAKAQKCDATQVGCTEYLQTSGNANLLANGGFEYFDQPIDGPIPSDYSSWTKSVALGAFAISADDPTITAANRAAVSLTGGSGDTMTQIVNTGYDLYERSFTFSIRAKASTACYATLNLEPNTTQIGHPRIPALPTDTNINVTNDWASYAVTLSIPSADTYTYVPDADGPIYDLKAGVGLGTCAGSQFIVDSAQLEPSTGPTQFRDYGSTEALYLNNNKVACNPADVGCQGYTPLAGGSEIFGQVRDSNRCPADKVGCDNFKLEPIIGVPPRAGGMVQIVAPKGQICSAADVGCEEYTNLDEVARGGEGKEYFKSVKQCLKPSQVQPGDPASPAISATYYTWVGDAQLGYVLRSYDLVKSNIGPAPCTNLALAPVGTAPSCDDANRIDTSLTCNASTLVSNPNCAQYYDSALNTYYQLRSLTVTITEDCHPYRNTIDQPDPARAKLIYYLSTKENLTCSAAAAGCRAYTGNASGTTRQVLQDNFETNGTANWIGGEATNASVNVGGHSMLVTKDTAAVTKDTTLKNQLFAGRTYLVSFTAAAASSTLPTVTVSFGNVSPSFSPIPGLTFSGSILINGWNEAITPAGPEWHSYSVGPVTLSPSFVQADERLGLVITGGDANIDNIVLTEVNDHAYLISSTVPQCTTEEVGCAAYRDRQNVTSYLTDFSRLCSEQVVGCEALIYTKNSDTPAAQTVKGVVTPADTVVTLVNNPAAYCPAASKGCDVFGQATYTADDRLVGYQSVYLINDPDRHSADLCLNEELSCQAYTTSSGTAAYFKDPQQRVCDYRTGGDGAGQWYITGTSILCPTVTPPLVGRPTGASCSTACRGVCDRKPALTCTRDSDCGGLGPCVQGGDRLGKACVSSADCPGASPRGGCRGNANENGNIDNGSNVGIPGQCTTDSDCAYSGNTCLYMAGSCPAEQNGCTEYRDPADPANCRSECPLSFSQGGSPDLVDGACKLTQCLDGERSGQNCAGNLDCQDAAGPHACVGGNGLAAVGIAGCRSYFYLRQSIETNAGACNGKVDTASGCRPFNDTTKSNLNFRGQ